MPDSVPDQRLFFRMLPRPALIVFCAALFCTFAPLGLLRSSSFAQERPVEAVLVSLVAAG